MINEPLHTVVVFLLTGDRTLEIGTGNVLDVLADRVGGKRKVPL